MEPLKYIFYFFLIVFIGIQFSIPDKNLGDPTPESSFIHQVETPTEIQKMLSNACYDCHSNQTKYPWYSSVAPVSWYISSHVEDGKAKLNFSEWEKYSDLEKKKKLDKISDLIKRRWMPMHEYLGQHPEAFMSNAEVEHFSNWFAEVQ